MLEWKEKYANDKCMINHEWINKTMNKIIDLWINQ